MGRRDRRRCRDPRTRRLWFIPGSAVGCFGPRTNRRHRGPVGHRVGQWPRYQSQLPIEPTHAGPRCLRTGAWLGGDSFHNQPLDLLGSTRPPRFILFAAVVLLGNQFAVRSEQGFGRHAKRFSPSCNSAIGERLDALHGRCSQCRYIGAAKRSRPEPRALCKGETSLFPPDRPTKSELLRRWRRNTECSRG